MVNVSIVICFRDWGLDRLALALRSHGESTLARRTEVIVSDFGSADPEAVKSVVEKNGGVYVRTDRYGPWSRSRALNAGVAQARGQYLITTDADMLFTPEAVRIILNCLERDPMSAQLLQCRDLAPKYAAGNIKNFEWGAYETNSKFRPRWGMGGMIALPMKVFELVRGYDERMEIYGGEDIDFANRLRRAGYRLNWINDARCRIFHIWHESSRAGADETVEGRAAIERNRNIVEQDRTWVRNLVWRHRRPGVEPLVTVAITTYNRAEYLEECIDSVLSQSVEDIELVIVDDGSTDGTSEAVKRFSDPRIRYFYQPNSGVSVARNRGLAEARGQFLVVQDDDDIMLPWRLEAHFGALQEGDHGTYGGWVDFDNSTGELEARPGKEFGLAQLLYSGGVMAHGTLMVRVDVLRHFGYNETLRAGTDFNLAIRMAMAGVRLRHTGKFHILRRFHGQNLTTTISDHQKESARKTTNLFRRGVTPTQEKAYRIKAKEVPFTQCDGADRLETKVSVFLPDGLVFRMASVSAKSDEIYEIVTKFSRDHDLDLRVYRAVDEDGQLADRNCCLYGVTKRQIRLLRDAGIPAHIEALSEDDGGDSEIDIEDAVVTRIADAILGGDNYHCVTLTAAQSPVADAVWTDEACDRRLVVLGRSQFLVAIRRFHDIEDAASYIKDRELHYGNDVKTLLIKASA